MNQCFCARRHGWLEGDAGGGAVGSWLSRRRGDAALGFRGPLEKQGHSHLHTKWLQQRRRRQRRRRPCFVGDNGLKSKTDSLLRGNAKPASELIKQLLCISKGAACLMADTRRGNLAALWPCIRAKKKTNQTPTPPHCPKKHDCTFNL